MTDRQLPSRSRRPPGRPREFDMDTALDGAVDVFRQRGYHAASINDLNEATGLTAGSLYKAFGDKRGVFLAAFEHYTRRRNTELQTQLGSQQTGRGKIMTVLHFYAEASHGSEGQLGCLVVASSTELTTLDDAMAKHVQAAMRRTENLLRRLLHEGQKDGSISPTIRPLAVARCLMALLQGFRVVGKSKCARSDMLAAANEAMRLLD